tara:strand:- start:33 stop:1223 length:1191 start_codon:yes stop_codon:yes gene_type:complete
MVRILYVFTGGRRSRFLAVRAGNEAPEEFLYGATYLQSIGYDVDILELSDLSPDKTLPIYSELTRRNTVLQQATGFTSTSHFFVGALNTLNQYDVIVAGSDSIAFGLSHFIAQDAIRPRVFGVLNALLFTQAIIRSEPLTARIRDISRDLYYRFIFGRYRKRRQIYRQLLETTSGTIYGDRSGYEMARRMFPEFDKKIHLVAACVDTEFWRPSLTAAQRDTASGTILFMGNDRGRDFELVLQIARHLPHFRFVFVTDRIQPEQVSANVTLKQGDWKRNLISDVEIRQIVQDSAIVIVPFKPGEPRTLTTVTMQAMACGKPALVTKTSALWWPTFIDRQNVWFVHSGKLSEWCESIERLMRDSVVRQRIGINARRLVERQNNLTVLGSKLDALIQQQ